MCVDSYITLCLFVFYFNYQTNLIVYCNKSFIFKNHFDYISPVLLQAAAFQPFFRAHSHHETRRREPWLFEDNYKNLIREAVRVRYSFLPYWYTLFYENELNGVPPMRPIWMEFPTERATFDLSDEYMLGKAVFLLGIFFETNMG